MRSAGSAVPAENYSLRKCQKGAAALSKERKVVSPRGHEPSSSISACEVCVATCEALGAVSCPCALTWVKLEALANASLEGPAKAQVYVAGPPLGAARRNLQQEKARYVFNARICRLLQDRGRP